MGGGQSQIEKPQAVRMPNPNDPAVLAAAKRAQMLAAQRGGRQSTLLSNATQGNTNGAAGALGQ